MLESYSKRATLNKDKLKHILIDEPRSIIALVSRSTAKFEYLFNLILEGEGGVTFNSSSLYFTC